MVREMKIMAINKNMVEETIVKAGMKVFHNAYLEGMHAGYPSILRTVLEESCKGKRGNRDFLRIFFLVLKSKKQENLLSNAMKFNSIKRCLPKVTFSKNI